MSEIEKAAQSPWAVVANLRISPEDKSVIDQAAKIVGKTRMEFIIDAARRAAHEALLDITLVVDGTTFNHFQEIFNAPPQPLEGLRCLMSLKAPWER